MSKIIEQTREPRSTGRGSDVYGVCDQCGKRVSETFVMQTRNRGNVMMEVSSQPLVEAARTGTKNAS